MGRSSKSQEAQEARERKLQRELEEKRLQERQNQIIRRTLISVLAVILLITGVTIGVKSCKNAQAKKLSDKEYVSMSVTYTNKAGQFCEGKIVMRLYADIAPITVANFQKLVSEGFYDGLTFHRIMSGFMIQGGDPKGDGTGGSTPIKGEFLANGVPNSLSHKRGVISMARRGDSMNSGSCQFFIVHEDSTHLDGQYAAFGEVISGMEIVDEIAETEVKYNGTEKSSPVNPVTIVKAELLESYE